MTGQEMAEWLKAHGLSHRSPPVRALIRAAEHGRIADTKCAMPECERGKDRRGDFESYALPLPNWMPSAEHIIPKRLGGKLKWDNVLLAHRVCNSEDFAKTVRKKPRKKKWA